MKRTTKVSLASKTQTNSEMSKQKVTNKLELSKLNETGLAGANEGG